MRKDNSMLVGRGKKPVSKERLHNRRITGTNRCDSCFKSHVGIGSRDDALVGQHDKILLTSASVTGSKEASGVTGILLASWAVSKLFHSSSRHSVTDFPRFSRNSVLPVIVYFNTARGPLGNLS